MLTTNKVRASLAKRIAERPPLTTQRKALLSSLAPLLAGTLMQLVSRAGSTGSTFGLVLQIAGLLPLAVYAFRHTSAAEVRTMLLAQVARVMPRFVPLVSRSASEKTATATVAE